MTLNKSGELTILHWNCDSIYNKFEYLKLYLNNKKIDIISLNELKINEMNANDIF
jgi:exonuclease III